MLRARPRSFRSCFGSMHGQKKKGSACAPPRPRFSRALDGGVDGGGRGRTSRCRETNECHTYAAHGAHACMHALPIAVKGAEAHRVGA
jgi:hypothetical protein